MKRTIGPLCEENLTLRLIKKEDMPHTLSWRNHPNHRDWFNSTQIILLENHLRWFEEYKKNDNDFLFLVTDQQTIRYGQLGIYNINWNDGNAEFGRFLVNQDYAGRGMMKKACKLALIIAKDSLKLNKLTLEVKANNAKAIHIYRASGFSDCDVKENGMLVMEKIL